MAAVELGRNDEFLERVSVAGGRDDGVEFVAIKLVAGLLDVGAETKPDAGPRSRSQSTMRRALPAADAVDAFDELRQREGVGRFQACGERRVHPGHDAVAGLRRLGEPAFEPLQRIELLAINLARRLWRALALRARTMWTVPNG